MSPNGLSASCEGCCTRCCCDTYGHGTHVAGIALAETNNGSTDTDVDTAGVGYSPNIKVMPLRVGDQSGIPTSAAVDAIYHAADNGANVINMSFGGKFGSASEEQAINYAWGKGLVVVASSGNDGSGRVSYPAAYTNCIAVGSTNWHDQLAPYSNKGNDLDVVAPGGDMDHYGDPGGIYSTMPTYDVYLTTSYKYDIYYDQLQGTSMAAPQVAGLAGLLFAVGVSDVNGDGSNDEIRDIIESTADDLGKPGWDREYGWGRINVYKAVQAVSGGTEITDIAITALDAPSSVVQGAVVEVNVTVDNVGNQDVTADINVTLTDVTDDVTVGTQTISGGLAVDLSTTLTFSWDTSSATIGDHTLTASHDFSDDNQSNDSKSTTVTVTDETTAELTVKGIDPNSMQAGTTIDVTVSGSGFATGAQLIFENGQGPAPEASSVVAVNSTTITAKVTAKSGGPPKDRKWDVRVTNTDGSSDVLTEAFTVTP